MWRRTKRRASNSTAAMNGNKAVADSDRSSHNTHRAIAINSTFRWIWFVRDCTRAKHGIPLHIIVCGPQ
jgi:hypothetical protein